MPDPYDNLIHPPRRFIGVYPMWGRRIRGFKQGYANRWRVLIDIRRGRGVTHFGSFATQEEAARARDAVVLKYCPKATLNFPKGT